MKILVTGGAGYIGSHTCIELIRAGYQVVVLDNLSNSKLSNLEKVSKITDKKLVFNKPEVGEFSFIRGDIRDKELLMKLFSDFKIEGVIHFAGLKAVGESVKIPLDYYNVNVVGGINLIKVMEQFNCKTLIFSSSAAVYGEPYALPIKENFPLNATSPYAQSKLIVENLLKDLFVSDNTWHIALLRYFNPIGAHSSGLIGDNPNSSPNNLAPFISQVAIGKQKELKIFGNDYDTHDGTGVRDYIHVEDIASSHVRALTVVGKSSQVLTLNLGTGVGYSVLDLVKAFEKVTNKKIPYKIHARRNGDVSSYIADPTLANFKLGWKAKKNLEKMCLDSWNFELKNQLKK
jgi:UDP-glucose 4-epimerase